MSPADFDLADLRVLSEVARHRDLVAAAVLLDLDVEQAEAAIGRLEALIGQELIDRGGAPVRATDAGILLAARADAAIDALAGDEDVTIGQVAALVAVSDGETSAANGEAIQALEGLVGARLVESAEGMALTPAGSKLAGACRLAIGEICAALDELAILSGRDQGTIRIGAHPSIIAHLLPEAIARFVAEHPPVVIEVQAVDAKNGVALLRDGRLDALVVDDDKTVIDDAIEREPLEDEAFVIAARAGHPVLSGPSPGPVRLAQAGWAVAPHGTGERRAWDKMFFDSGLFPPAPSVTCPSPALLNLVGRSDLLTVAPRKAVAQSGGRLVQLGYDLPSRLHFVVATRAGWAPTPAQATFLEEVASLASKTTLAF